jgi:hypothetical protein
MILSQHHSGSRSTTRSDRLFWLPETAQPNTIRVINHPMHTILDDPSQLTACATKPPGRPRQRYTTPKNPPASKEHHGPGASQSGAHIYRHHTTKSTPLPWDTRCSGSRSRGAGGGMAAMHRAHSSNHLAPNPIRSFDLFLYVQTRKSTWEPKNTSYLTAQSDVSVGAGHCGGTRACTHKPGDARTEIATKEIREMCTRKPGNGARFLYVQKLR